MRGSYTAIPKGLVSNHDTDRLSKPVKSCVRADRACNSPKVTEAMKAEPWKIHAATPSAVQYKLYSATLLEKSFAEIAPAPKLVN